MSVLKAQKFFIYLLVSAIMSVHAGRSPWRPRDPLIPELSVHWAGDPKSHYLRDSCLEYHALFCKFDKQQFNSYMIPNEPISYRLEPQKTVDSATLKELAEQVTQEIKQHKKTYTHFTVLKKSDFNARLASGLIILKYKKYPFILKLFLKTPETFVKLSEGVIPKFFFRMGGGTNRHLAGFTRIPNLEIIRNKINESSYWSKRIDTPRKWHWVPKEPRWIVIEGNNIGSYGTCRTSFPATCGIIVDSIETERSFSLSRKDDCDFGLAFSRYIGNRMDAHVDNLLVEKGTGKIVLIDTEHFPTMVGLKEPMNFNSYQSWYLQLSGKCFRANFLRHKKMRRDMQRSPQPELYTLYKPHQQESLVEANFLQKDRSS